MEIGPLTVETHPTLADVQFLEDRLHEYNDAQTGIIDGQSLALFIRDAQHTIAGVALVGSYARGEARPDSDIDVMLLCTEPRGFLTETSWIHCFGEVRTCHTEDWGVVTSLRVRYTKSFEVEFGLTTLA